MNENEDFETTAHLLFNLGMRDALLLTDQVTHVWDIPDMEERFVVLIFLFFLKESSIFFRQTGVHGKEVGSNFLPQLCSFKCRSAR